jgi:predicted DNA-binding ArsR family transcriptional regulator
LSGIVIYINNSVHLLSGIVISYNIVNKIVQSNSSFLKTMIEDELLSAANISAALLGINSTFLCSVCDRARASRQGRACRVPALLPG